MIKNLILLFLLICASVAAKELKPVKLSDEKEAWLGRNLNEAIELHKKLFNTGSQDHILSYNLGYLNFLNTSDDKALSYLRISMQLNPDYPYTYLTIGKIYQRKADSENAQRMYQKGLEIDPDNFDLKIALSDLYILQGKLNAAEDLYYLLLKEKPDDQYVRMQLGKLLRKQKRLDKAAEIMNEEDKFFPVRSFLIEKSNLYRDLNKKTEVKKSLTRLVREYPYSDSVQQYRNILMDEFNVDSLEIVPVENEFQYKIDPSEERDYIVKYGFITLGWMKMRVEDVLEINGKKIFHIVFYVNSNPDFSFIINLNHVYESFVDSETLSAVMSRLYTPGDIYQMRMLYYEYEKSRFYAYLIWADGRYELIQKDLPKSVQDGTSILFYTRGLVSNKTGGITPVVINERYKIAQILYLNEFEKMNYYGKNVKSIKISAKAKFQGVAGMTGDAWGWFSPDEELVPIIGKLKIIIGSISIKLDDE